MDVRPDRLDHGEGATAVITIGRQRWRCAFCVRYRRLVFEWTAVDGGTVKACLRHTRAAWRYLDWRNKQ